MDKTEEILDNGNDWGCMDLIKTTILELKHI